MIIVLDEVSALHPIKEYLKKQFYNFFLFLLMFATNWLFLFLSVYCLRETLINLSYLIYKSSL